MISEIGRGRELRVDLALVFSVFAELACDLVSRSSPSPLDSNRKSGRRTSLLLARESLIARQWKEKCHLAWRGWRENMGSGFSLLLGNGVKIMKSKACSKRFCRSVVRGLVRRPV